MKTLVCRALLLQLLHQLFVALLLLLRQQHKLLVHLLRRELPLGSGDPR